MLSDLNRQRLVDIRENIQYARDFIGVMDFQEFATDLKPVYATVWALEIISEASRYLPDDLKERRSEIDWIAVRDAGNIYRHAYEMVTEQRIWDTVMIHLAPLEQAVLRELT